MFWNSFLLCKNKSRLEQPNSEWIHTITILRLALPKIYWFIWSCIKVFSNFNHGIKAFSSLLIIKCPEQRAQTEGQKYRSSQILDSNRKYLHNIKMRRSCRFDLMLYATLTQNHWMQWLTCHFNSTSKQNTETFRQ